MKRASVFLLAFLIVSLSLTLVHPVFAAYIFEDGFESNDFSAWTNTTGSPTIVGSPVRQGSYSMKNDAVEYATKTFGSTYATLYCRVYVRFASLPNHQQYQVGIIKVGKDGDAYSTSVRVKNTTGTNCYFFLYDGGAGSTTGTDVVAVDTWYCVELKRSTSVDSKVYIDGVEKLSLAHGYHDANRVDIGAETYHNSVGYYDCVVVDDEYIGVISEEEEKNFYGVINPQFTINHASTWTFNRYTIINPTFTILSKTQFISATILNFFGSITETITINYLKAVSFNRESIINEIFTVTGLYTSGTFLDFFGSIIQQFTVTTTKAFSFTRYALINEIFTVTSIFEMPGLLNLYGIINLVFDIVGYSPIAAPLTIDVVLGIAAIGFIIAIVALAVAINKKD